MWASVEQTKPDYTIYSYVEAFAFEALEFGLTSYGLFLNLTGNIGHKIKIDRDFFLNSDIAIAIS